MPPSLIAWLPTPALWRTALAAAIAWQVAAWAVGSRSYFAPLAAVLCAQVTVAGSVARALERTAGVAGGIVLALAAVRIVGVSAVSVGGLVLVGMAVSQRLGLGPTAVSQVAVSAILVLSLGAHSPGYALSRIVDTAIGAATAVALQVFLFPADFSDRAERALRSLACRQALLWRAAARVPERRHRHDFVRLWHRANDADKDLGHAEDELRLAREALRMSPLRMGRRVRLARFDVLLHVLGLSLRHGQAALRLLAEHPAPAAGPLLGTFCRAAARTAVAVGQESRPRRRRARLDAATERLAAAAALLATAARPQPEAAALAVEADEWLRDLSQAVRAADRYRPPSSRRGRGRAALRAP